MKTTDINRVILFQLDQANKAAKHYSQQEFDRLGLGITVEQWVLLKIIEEHVELSQKELAEHSLRDPASITRTLDLLEKKNFMRRERSAADRRNQQVVLTSVGKNFVTEHMAMVKKHRQQSTAGFEPHELQQLSDLLQRVKDNMN